MNSFMMTLASENEPVNKDSARYKHGLNAAYRGNVFNTIENRASYALCVISTLHTENNHTGPSLFTQQSQKQTKTPAQETTTHLGTYELAASNLKN